MAKMHFIMGNWVTVESVEDLAEFVNPEVYPAICGLVDDEKFKSLKQVESDIEDLEKRIAKTKTLRTTTLEDYLMKMRDLINPYI